MGSKTLFLPTGEGRTSFVPRIELAEAGARALLQDKPKEIYELNGHEAVNFGEIAGFLSDILGTPISYVSPDISQFKQALAERGAPEGYIGMMAMFSQGIVDEVFNAHYSDLEELLGRKSLPIADFLRQVYG